MEARTGRSPKLRLGINLRGLTNYPPQHTTVALGVEPWPGEAAHNYHSLGVS